MCAPSPPPAPDFAAQATAQGVANKETAVAQSQASNPNITGPSGTRRVTWKNDPVTGNPVPTITDAYSPTQQQIFNTNQQSQQGLATVGRDAVGRIGGILGQDVNFDKTLGTQAQGRQEVIDAMMSRFDTDFDRQRDDTNSNLIARGIRPGTEAYEAEMDRINRSRTDALQQATISADTKSMDERRQAIVELMAQRQTPLNEISALRSGSQVAPLAFQQFSGTNMQAPNIYGAAKDQYGAQSDIYNAGVGQSNATMGAIGSLGAAAIGMMF